MNRGGRHLKRYWLGLVCVVLMSGCHTVEVVPSEQVRDVEQLTSQSPVILIGHVTRDAMPFTYQDVTFYEAEVKVKQMYRDKKKTLQLDERVTLIQNDDDIRLDAGDDVLLFLKEMEGPINESAYRIVGLDRGQFTLTPDETAKPIDPSSPIRSFDLNTLENVVATIPYAPEQNKRLTEDEIEALNEEERRLQESQ